MRTIAATEYGIKIIIGTSFDMSANTLLGLRFEKPDGTTLDVTPTLGTIEVTTTAGTFAANTWAEYTFVTGNIGADDDGTWKAQLQYTDATSYLLASIAQFTVTDGVL